MTDFATDLDGMHAHQNSLGGRVYRNQDGERVVGFVTEADVKESELDEGGNVVVNRMLVFRSSTSLSVGNTVSDGAKTWRITSALSDEGAWMHTLQEVI